MTSFFDSKVELNDEFGFCMSPEFIDFQLSESLIVSGLDQFDIALIHNPELLWDSIQYNKEVNESFLIFDR